MCMLILICLLHSVHDTPAIHLCMLHLNMLLLSYAFGPTLRLLVIVLNSPCPDPACSQDSVWEWMSLIQECVWCKFTSEGPWRRNSARDVGRLNCLFKVSALQAGGFLWCLQNARDF